jgi:bleomycin hydrolase
LNKLLKTKLREHALVLRDISSSLRSSGQFSDGDIIAALRSKKEELLGEVYNVMSTTLGSPRGPNDKFVWDYYDKDGKAGRWEGSAKEFYFVRKTFAIAGQFTIVSPPRHSQTSIILHLTLSL